jgi:PAS domain S-box-containing protein
LPAENRRPEWARWSMKPWRTADGRIGGALLLSEVITDQVEARRAVAEGEARFRATFENAAVGIAHVDPHLGWLRVNEAFCRILGYSVEELLAKSVGDITHPDDFEVDIVNSALMRAGKLNSAEMDKRYVTECPRDDRGLRWSRDSVPPARSTPTSLLAGLFIESLNDVIALHAKWVQANLRSRIPGVIWATLYFLAGLAMAGIGYHERLTSLLRSPALAIVVVTFSALFISSPIRPSPGRSV